MPNPAVPANQPTPVSTSRQPARQSQPMVGTLPAPLAEKPPPQRIAVQPNANQLSSDEMELLDDPTPAPHNLTLLDVLLQQQILSEEQANQVKLEQMNSGQPVDNILISNKYINEEQLTRARAEFNNIPFIKLSETGVSPEALSELPEIVAERFLMLPFSINTQDDTLWVAMADPLDLSAIDFASQKTGKKIVPHYAMPSELKTTINERYSQSISTEVNQAVEETSQIRDLKAEQQDLSALSGEIIRQAPVAKIIETILAYAVKARASDVHIEPQENRTRIRYRIDGILSEKLILPRTVHEAVVSRIKILADLKIDEKRLPQDGRSDFTSDGQEVDLRISTLPTINGEKVVMRLLKKNVSAPTLAELGLTGIAAQRLERAVSVPRGIVLVTGPTGSGKTTTLYSVLNKINTKQVNIITLEDPVEYQIAGVNQVQTNPAAGLTFASGLRSFLRQDPNIVMVGEIRDAETAELAVQASLTGHLVFSTLHTSSAATSIPRMIDMGAVPFLLASSLELTMAQRIVRRINPRFRQEYTPPPEVMADIKKVLGPYFQQWCKQRKQEPDQVTLYRPSPDRPANEPEFIGRIGIFEVMPITDTLRSLILKNRPAGEFEQNAVKGGMLLMKQDGYLKVLDGVTTVEEVLRVAQV